MNRYWLFAFYDYEAIGGLDDLQYTFNYVKDAKKYAKEHSKLMKDSCHILDSTTWKIIWRADGYYVIDDNDNHEFMWEKIDGGKSRSVGEPDDE